MRYLNLKLLLLLTSIVIQLALCSPVEDDDTSSIDATTIAAEEEKVISSTTPLPPVESARFKSMDQCRSARGGVGYCTRVSDCFKILETENGTLPVRNRVLAEMLVEASGFCDNANGRSTIDFKTPNGLEEILRSDSEVLLCCPEIHFKEPEVFGFDEIDKDEDVYSEMFKGKRCGYSSKQNSMKDKVPTSTSTTTSTTATPPIDGVDIVPANCDKTKTTTSTNCTEKIVKGRKTKVGEYPWIVAMMNRGRQFCGGSLINSNTVLSAAHCVMHMTASDVKNLRLQIGDWDIYKKDDTKHEVRSVRAVKYHKGFSMRHLQHDIALLILDTPVQYSDTIQPVCLHSGTPEVETGKQKADVAGWGALSEGGGQPSDLRAVTVRVLSHNECISRYSSTRNKIGQAMVCAGADKGEDSCQGDSGGPLTIDSKEQAKQIGIVSWGIGCGRYPGVYTKVALYLNWINTNMVKGMGYEH